MMRRSLTALAAALAVGGIWSQTAAAIAPPVGECPDVVFIGAAGSGEGGKSQNNGMGNSVKYIADRLEQKLAADGETMRRLAVIYTAAPVETLTQLSTADISALAAHFPTGVARYYVKHLRPYLASIQDGISQTITETRLMAQNCPDADIVLAGYSQGAMAVHQAELQMDAANDEALDNVAGTILLADGDRVPHSAAKRFGNAPLGGEGIRPWAKFVAIKDVFDPESTVQICDAWDPVCDFNKSRIRHLDKRKHDYFNNGRRVLLDQAVDWFSIEIMGLGPA